MRYIVDEKKNITHVVVPIEEWNKLQKYHSEAIINPYKEVIGFLETKFMNGSIPLLYGLASIDKSGSLMKNKLTYNILRELLEGYTLPSQELRSKIFHIQKNFYLSYVGDAKSIAIGYILRSEDFYARLTKKDKKLKSIYGFDVENFFQSANSELIEILHKKSRYDFIFSSLGEMNQYFSLTPVRLRVRKEPEVLRLFYFDLFETVKEILLAKASFEETFKNHPLVDIIAKAVYSENTLSGSTSRVYKARKEAEKIVQGDWVKYAEPII